MKIISTAEAARRLGVTANTVRARCDGTRGSDITHGGDAGWIPVRDANFLGNLKFSVVRKPVYFNELSQAKIFV